MLASTFGRFRLYRLKNFDISSKYTCYFDPDPDCKIGFLILGQERKIVENNIGLCLILKRILFLDVSGQYSTIYGVDFG